MQVSDPKLMKSILNPKQNTSLTAILAILIALVAGQKVAAQLMPPVPPIPFEINNATFSGTVTITAPTYLTNTNNIEVPVGTIIAPITFSGTVNDIDNITQSYSRRTKLWTLNYVGGSSAISSATVISNTLAQLNDGSDTNYSNPAGWTFASTVDPMTGDLGPLELVKFVNGVVTAAAPQTGINMTFDGISALRSGSIGYNSMGDVTSMTAVSREAVNVEVMPEAYTYMEDPDAATFYLYGVSSNNLTLRTNVITYDDGMGGTGKETNVWTSVSGTIPLTGLGTGAGGGGAFPQ
jgi:hypothetical protein